MTPQRRAFVKKMWLWCIVIASVVTATYLGFISLVFVWIGFTHANQSGFWVPILAGTVSLSGSLWLFFLITRRVLGQIKEKDLLNI